MNVKNLWAVAPTISAPVQSKLTSRATRALVLAATASLAVVACDGSTASVAPSPSAQVIAPASLASSAPISDQYIITFRDSVADVRGTATRLVAQARGQHLFTYTAALHGFAAKMSPQAAAALAHNPQVARIEQDMPVKPADVELNPTWGLDRIDQRALPLDRSYGYASTGAGVNVYIIDTGIRTTHVEFGGRAFGAYTVINDGRGTADCNGHGTHVAGTVGGTKYGVAKGATLYAVRVMDCAGSGTTSGIISAIDWITQHRVLPAVANMSLTTTSSSTVNAAVEASISAGVVYTAAAGNNGGDACGYSPASAPDVLTTSATGNDDSMQGFSNFGRCVHIFAPGQAIRSAYFVDDTSSIINAGTSMAAPHVAGVAALYLSANPSATPAQVSAAIIGGATPNVVTRVPSGTPNLLLYSNISSGSVVAPPPPVDTTSPPPPPPPPPAVDQRPLAAVTVSCQRGNCTFNGTGSTDDHGIASYSWNFGDGSPISSGATLSKIAHTYPSAGTYTVTLTVTDTIGQQGSASVSFRIKKP